MDKDLETLLKAIHVEAQSIRARVDEIYSFYRPESSSKKKSRYEIKKEREEANMQEFIAQMMSKPDKK